MILNYLPTECQSVMKDALSFCLDIYGLLLFLGVDPYCHQKWWKSLLFEPYRNGNKQPLYELLAKILWRSVKKDVIHEVLFSKVFVCVILRKGIFTSYWWKRGEGAKQSIKLHLIEVLMQLNSSLFTKSWNESPNWWLDYFITPHQSIVKITVCKDKSEANFLNKFFSKKQHMHEVYHQMPSCFVNKVWSDSKLCSWFFIK